MLFSLFLHSFACDLLAWYWSATRHRIGTVQHSQLSEFSRLAHWSRPCWTAMNGNGRRPRRLWPILGSTRRSDADLCPTWRVQGSDECPTFQQSLLLAMLLVVCYLFTYVHMCPHVSTCVHIHVSACVHMSLCLMMFDSCLASQTKSTSRRKKKHGVKECERSCSASCPLVWYCLIDCPDMFHAVQGDRSPANGSAAAALELRFDTGIVGTRAAALLHLAQWPTAARYF